MKQYKYTGAIDIEVQGIGIVEPNQVIEVEDFNHPLFKEIKAVVAEDKNKK